MTDEIETEDLSKKAADLSANPEPETGAADPGGDVAAAAFDPAGEEIRLAPQPPVDHSASGGNLSDVAPDQIPGFLRRCAKETLAQEGPEPAEIQYRYRALADDAGGGRAFVPPGETGFDGVAGDATGDGGPATPVGTGSGFPTGARLRGEKGRSAPGPAGLNSPEWSDTARNALSELLTDIDNEQARRVSNRDKFAALAGKRRTTWPLTALIISFLFVVVAYSVRNVDAGGAPGKIWRQTLALVTGPQQVARVSPPPQVNQAEPPAAEAPVQAGKPLSADPRVRSQRPTARKKSIGLVFEPVKIVGPLGPLAPASQRVAAAKPQAVIPRAAPGPRLRQMPAVSANAAVAALLSPEPAPAAVISPSTSIALAPSIPVSPDKMPLASLAISAPEIAADPKISPERFRRVASVAPDLIGMAAKSRVDARPGPAAAPAAAYDLATATPQLAPSQTPPPPSPVTTVAEPDRYGIKTMLARAEKLLDARDVASARLLFERAASYGSAEGAFGAAKTYDPVCFEKLGVYGVPAEPEKATALYQIAIDGGHVQAVEYLSALNALRRKLKLKAATAQR